MALLESSFQIEFFLNKSYNITFKKKFKSFVRKMAYEKIDFQLYFNILLGKWEGIINRPGAARAVLQTSLLLIE